MYVGLRFSSCHISKGINIHVHPCTYMYIHATAESHHSWRHALKKMSSFFGSRMECVIILPVENVVVGELFEHRSHNMVGIASARQKDVLLSLPLGPPSNLSL